MTVREFLNKKKGFYKAFWPDGTRTDAYGDEFERKAEEFAECEAELDHEDDYDEEGVDYGTDYLYVYERK